MGGSFNPVKVLKEVALNVATGGYYGVAKGGHKAVTTGKVLAGAADALGSVGPAGSVLQPTVGTKNSLLIQSAIAGGSLAAGGAGAAAGGAGTVGVPTGVAGTGAASATGVGAGGTTLGTVGTGALLAASAAGAASPLLTKPPKLPEFDPMEAQRKIENEARDAARAVQSKEAEARRVRASKRVSSVLTGGTGITGSSPSTYTTLQPAQPRKSVLG